MDRDPRDRERGVRSSDVESLWIDFLLLPQKLEEHLAAGTAAIPTPPDLISVFLEQALVNHKSVVGNNPSANGTIKDAEPQGAVRMTTRTASLLCERAARVAVVAQHTLSDIELFIPSQLHQFVLLKALIMHDKNRSLLHQCNLHRWIIHKALQIHPVGSASPNVVLPVNRLGSWVAADNLGEVLHGVLNMNGDVAPPPNTGEFHVEEERSSVEYLEKVLYEEGFSLEQEGSMNFHADSNSQKVTVNGGSIKDQSLSAAFKCQVMLDVAEVHFMRGRIKKAHNFFCKCGEAVTFLSVGKVSNAIENRESSTVTTMPNMASVSKVSPVPQDRLAGFIIACKMLLGTPEYGKIGEMNRPAKCAGLQEPCCVGIPSPTQWAIIASEQSRLAARKNGITPTSQPDPLNGSGNSSPGKENVGAMMTGRTVTDMVVRTPENSVYLSSSKRSKKRSYHEAVNGNLPWKEAELETEKNELARQVKESGRKDTCLYEMRREGDATVTKKWHSADRLANGSELKNQEKRMFQLEEGSWEWRTVDVKDTKPVAPGLSEMGSRISVDMVKKESVTSVIAAGFGTEVQLFVDLKGDPSEELSPEVDIDVRPMPVKKLEKSLVQTFVEDILRGYLSWGYCQSVEKDPMLSEPVRAKLAACNVVRSVLEGAPVEAFLRVADHFENNKDAVEFFMQLLLAIKVTQEGNTFPVCRSCGVDSKQNGRLVKLGCLKHNFAVQGVRDSGGCAVTHCIENLAMYVCCVIDKHWCWHSALKQGLVCQNNLPRCLPVNRINEKVVARLESLPNSVEHLRIFTEHEILLSLVQVESLVEMESLVGRVRNIIGSNGFFQESSVEFNGSSHDFGHTKNCPVVTGTYEQSQSPAHPDLVKLIGKQSKDTGGSQSASSRRHSQGNLPLRETCLKCQSTINGPTRSTWFSFEADVAGILRGRAFNAIVIAKDTFISKRLYELALGFQPKDCDSPMMLWFLERSMESDGDRSRSLPVNGQVDALPSFVLLEFVILQLIEKELWVNLSEFCKWAVSVVLLEPVARDGEQNTKTEKDTAQTGLAAACENAAKRNQIVLQFKTRKFLQTLNVARKIVDLMPLCVSIQTAASQNHFNEDAARLGSTLSQLFEEFMCILVGGDSEQAHGTDDTGQWTGNQLGMGLPPPPGAAGVPLISKITNPRVLMALASLTAGWLQRCNAVGLTPWRLAVERYGALAGVTAGAALPPPVGSLPYPPPVLRPVPPRVSPEFGRDLFGVLLEGIVSLPGVVERDREKGHRWLQGLADLAFEDEAFVKSLRLYLQAGSIRSAQYCDRASAMNRDIFTPWVIQRMVTACRAIGANLQAAVLCQCLPVPDHESAFRILQENTLIVDQDAAAYFECLWEVPILELLVHLHSRARDEARVQTLIGLLQQPALNVHNPPAIRQAHIATMEQRFLQRLAGELL